MITGRYIAPLVVVLMLAALALVGCGGGSSGVVGTYLNEGTTGQLTLNADGTWTAPGFLPPSGTYKVAGDEVTFYKPDGSIAFQLTFNGKELVYTGAGVPTDTFTKQK
ncbi:MAG: hypothetical protein KKF41_04610 [Actinobacteria bacterium]|nr:hypothetical protein [Actinomycetota bacterium]MBU1943492.1 hypothetical protein [Actinomycetota bacterium]MBU2686849.1 hypothetical protein [Actinomycetota bacterium]